MVMSRDEKYLPLNQVRLYLMGAEPVTQPFLTKLLSNKETNRIEIQDFHTSLVEIGQCCTHLAVVTPLPHQAYDVHRLRPRRLPLAQ